MATKRGQLRYARLERLEQRSLLTAIAVADLYLSDVPDSTGLIHTSAVANGNFYFGVVNRLSTAASGKPELWKSDGTPAGTQLLKSFNTTVFASDKPAISNLTNINGTLYFTVSTDQFFGEFELWKSDGTADGTTLVKAFTTSNSYDPNFGPSSLNFTPVGNQLFFTTGGSASSPQLWVSDGTPLGTTQIGSTFSSISKLTDFGGALYFSGGASNSGLWKSNGTTLGTTFVKSISFGSAAPVVVGSTLYFTDFTAALYESDGSAGGTRPVVPSGGPSAVVNLAASNGKLFFSGSDSNGSELWESDGSAGGTFRIADIRPGSSGSNPTSLTDVNGTLYFIAGDGSSGTELWSSDGTNAGTARVSDIELGSASSTPRNLTNVNGTLYFSAQTTAAGRELWKTNGSDAGTMIVKDLYTSIGGSLPQNLVGLGNLDFFQAVDPVAGFSQFVSDGTAGGTVLLKDLVDQTLDVTISLASRADGSLLYSAGDTTNTGRELYITDSSANSGALVKDIFTGSTGSSPANLLEMNGVVYFAATDNTHGTELWQSDGTSVGTILLKDLNTQTSSASSSPTSFIRDGNLFLFNAFDTTGPQWLFKSDGTAAGTVPVLTSGSQHIALSGPIVLLNGFVYYGLNSISRTNGTSSSTIKVIGTSIFNGKLALANGKLWIGGDNGSTGRELWTSDGTTEGTVLVKDIAPGSTPSFGVNSSSPEGFTVFDGWVYFAASDAVNGRELWRTDGTAANTTLVKDIYNDGFTGLFAAGSSPDRFAPGRDALLFAARDADHGYELWRTDGTSAGTTLVKDIFTGLTDSTIRSMMNVGGTIYFTADDGVHGRELWTTDGTAAGTFMLADINPGPGSSNPMNLYNANGKLYFTANDGVSGPKLYVINDTTPPTVWRAKWSYDHKPNVLSLTMNENVSATLASSDFQLINPATGLPVPGVTWTYAYDTETNTATFTFTGPNGGVIPDGNYRLLLPADSMGDLAGNTNADYALDFFSLTGDANHDRFVNALDFNSVASNFGKSSKTFPDGDFNFDGKVNTLDFNSVATHFNTQLDPASPEPPAAALTSQKSLFSGSQVRLIDGLI
jgi:ELWxxDGT repeat protein